MKCPILLSALILILLYALLIPAEGATIHGVVYNWENLEPLPKAVIIINSTPEQRFVTEDGTYSFNLTPGTYLIKAYYYKEGKLKLYAEENVTVKREGEFVHDIILFPPLQLNVEEPKVDFPTLESPDYTIECLVIAIAIVGVVALLLLKRKTRSVEVKEDEVKLKEKIEEELPNDLTEVIEVLRKEGGRMTQKDLRKRLRYSEAKMSLIVADLERRGIVEKVRKGRGNIIFLKKF